MAHTPQQGRPVVLFRARGGLVFVHHWLMMVLLVMLAFVQFLVQLEFPAELLER